MIWSGLRIPRPDKTTNHTIDPTRAEKRYPKISQPTRNIQRLYYYKLPKSNKAPANPNTNLLTLAHRTVLVIPLINASSYCRCCLAWNIYLLSFSLNNLAQSCLPQVNSSIVYTYILYFIRFDHLYILFWIRLECFDLQSKSSSFHFVCLTI